jgi:hypothetical protein
LNTVWVLNFHRIGVGIADAILNSGSIAGQAASRGYSPSSTR